MIKTTFGILGAISTLVYSTIVLIFLWRGILDSVQVSISYGSNAFSSFLVLLAASIGAMLSLTISGFALGSLWKKKRVRILAILSTLASFAMFSGILWICLATTLKQGVVPIILSSDTDYVMTLPLEELNIVVNCHSKNEIDITLMKGDRSKFRGNYENGGVSVSYYLYDENDTWIATVFDNDADGMPDRKQLSYPKSKRGISLYPSEINWNNTVDTTTTSRRVSP